MSTWAAIAIVAVVAAMTYSMRAVVIVAMANRTISPPLERALRNVGPAVLAALAINLAAGGEGEAGLELAEGAALVVAGLIAWWRRSMLISLGAGMATLWLLNWLM